MNHRTRFTVALIVLVAGLAASGCKKAASDLPDYGAVPAFAMTDQSGAPFTNETMRNRVWAAAFIFTRCPSACPKVTRAMRGVQLDAAKRSVPLTLVSFTVDPENDTPEVLRKYAADYGADLKSWSFVTGDARAVKTTAEQGFKIAADGIADPSKPNFGIDHGTSLVLVDKGLRIRGYFSSSDGEALAGLVSAASKL